MRSLTLFLIPLIFLSSCSTVRPQSIPNKQKNIIEESSGGLKPSTDTFEIEMKGYSMEKTIHDNQTIRYEKDTNNIKRGDIIVFEIDGLGKYIKRVIGIPGDVIMFSSGNILLKSLGESSFTELHEPYLLESSKGHTYLPNYVKDTNFLVPDSSYWVMGDNRQNSSDSRQCFQSCYEKDFAKHFLDKSQILGIVVQ